MPLLRFGSHGPDVAALQRALTLAGFPCVDDSRFGPATLAAVKAFQSAQGLTPDGIAGPKTLANLNGPDTEPAPAPDDLGVDVSQFAGVPDYEALRAQGFTFCVPRLGSGTASIDTLAARQIAAAKAAGLTAEAGYVYMQSAYDGAEQAEHAARLSELFDLPVFVDMEPRKDYDPATKSWPWPSDAPAVAGKVADAYLTRLESLGVRHGVYGARYYLPLLKLDQRFGALPFWEAAYGPTWHGAAPMGKPVLWQYKGNVKVGGAAVDYNRAIGGVAALRRALGTG